MSWQEYVDEHLMCEFENGGRLQSAAILGHDGGVWAESPDFPQISDAEVRRATILTIAGAAHAEYPPAGNALALVAMTPRALTLLCLHTQFIALSDWTFGSLYWRKVFLFCMSAMSRAACALPLCTVSVCEAVPNCAAPVHTYTRILVQPSGPVWVHAAFIPIQSAVNAAPVLHNCRRAACCERAPEHSSATGLLWVW